MGMDGSRQHAETAQNLKSKMKKSTRAYIYNANHLRDACHTSYDGKSPEQRQKPEVVEVMEHIDDFARATLSDIITGRYRVGTYRHFKLRDKKKERDISVLPYADRCVQNLYKGAVEPLIINQATDDMCAGLPGRGVTARDPRWSVVRKIQRMMRSSKAVYMWQGDISKFYDNIRNVLVMKQLERIITDKVVLALLRQHIMQQRKLAIGDPISHLIASLMMAPLVRHLKAHGAKIVNYADDFWGCAETEEEMYRIAHLAEEFAITQQRLHFKPYQIRRIEAGPFRFCGFVFHPNGKVFLAKDTKKKYIRSRHKKRSLASYNGMLMACNARHLRKKVELHDNFKNHHHATTTHPIRRQETEGGYAHREETDHRR